MMSQVRNPTLLLICGLVAANNALAQEGSNQAPRDSDSSEVESVQEKSESQAFLDCVELYSMSMRYEFDDKNKNSLNKCLGTFGSEIITRAESLAEVEKEQQDKGMGEFYKIEDIKRFFKFDSWIWS